MNGKSFGALFLMFILGVLVSAAVQAVPVVITDVEVNGDTLFLDDPNRLDLVRGQDLDVKVRLEAVDNGSDVEVHAFVSGFEFNREDAISDVSNVFDVEQSVTYVKRLKLRLPDLADEDDYLLRVMITDRNTEALIENYRIKIDVPRHNVIIKDVVLNPETVVAGRALLATVRVKNMGEKDEEGLKVKVTIPDLGVSATDFIDELESGESTTSEELYLRIPVCAKEGSYNVRATVEFNEGFDKVSTTEKLDVEQSEACVEAVKEKTVIVVSKEPQVVVIGGAGAVYTFTVTNAGSASRVYTFVVEAADDWASVRLSPSNVVALQPGEMKTVSLFVAAKPDASAGERTFTVTVKDQAGNVLEQISLKSTVKPAEGARFGNIRSLLEIGLVVLVVLLIIVALIFIVSKLKGKDEEEGQEPKTYY